MADFRQRCAPALAGQWYPGSPERLRAEVDSYLSNVAETPSGLPRALVVPHAGLGFSGQTAGRGYALLRGRSYIKRIVLLAPSHRAYFHGVAVGDYGVFETPLGDVRVDTEACAGLLDASSLVVDQPGAFLGENALELQLPFLKAIAPDALLVPALCQGMGLSEVRSVATTLADHLWQDDTVWIASSDFTHYGRSFGYVPFDRDVEKRLEDLDRGAIDRILQVDCEGFLEYVDRTGATICGAMPIAVLLGVLEQREEQWLCHVLEYTTSGRMTQDFAHSVSYATILVTDAEGSDVRVAEEPDADSLSESNRTQLLRLAREAIETSLRGEPAPEPDERVLTSPLLDDGACFVTLHLEGNLRGCIGHLEATEALYKNVIRNARNAAFSDYRFSPVTTEELGRIDIDISVLTPSRRIQSLDEFAVGRHGIILEKGRHRAVFLPQVAPEQQWDRDTTLQHLSLKAGLAADGWRKGATFSVFEAIVFGEE